MDDTIKNVLIAGVGGQGVLLISEILSLACMKSGFDVKKSEVHGMAQRGGSVVSHVRYGRQVLSPLIENGTAHLLVALEELEAMRWSGLLRSDGTIIMNTQQIKPMPVAVGLQEYPREIPAQLRRHIDRLVTIDAVDLARRAGNIRSVNIVMMGSMSTQLGLDPAVIRSVLRSKVPRKTWMVNLQALKMGIKAYRENIQQSAASGRK